MYEKDSLRLIACLLKNKFVFEFEFEFEFKPGQLGGLTYLGGKIIYAQPSFFSLGAM